MNYHYLEPEVAGGLGSHSILDHAGEHLRVTKLHYEFDVWLGDALLTSHPVYIIIRKGQEALTAAAVCGIEFDDVEITKSQLFEDLYPGRELPDFVWMKVQGTAGQDDFGIANNQLLVVSDRALEVLEPLGIGNAVKRAYP
ncbi:MAG: hypothetical protein AAB892_01020 [Patescibacteria group bacterium]